MSRVRTLAQLRTDVRQRADIENSQHISDTELTRYINQSIAALYALIVEMDEDEFAAEATWTVTAGTVESTISYVEDAVDVPVSIYKLLSVDVVDGDGRKWPVQRFSLRDRTWLEDTTLPTGQIRPTRYRLRGISNLIWAPPFESDTQVRVTYIPSPTDLSADSDEYDGRVGWEEWVILDSAIKCMIKEESDDSQLVRERQLAEARIRQQIAIRDRGEAQRIRNVMPRENW